MLGRPSPSSKVRTEESSPVAASPPRCSPCCDSRPARASSRRTIAMAAPTDCSKLRATGEDTLHFRRPDRRCAFAATLGDDPALLWIETPSNPLLRITDIRSAPPRRKSGRACAADNTLLSPCRQRPLDLGCDLVIHSTTKVLNGHADLFGGALLARSGAG